MKQLNEFLSSFMKTAHYREWITILLMISQGETSCLFEKRKAKWSAGVRKMDGGHERQVVFTVGAQTWRMSWISPYSDLPHFSSLSKFLFQGSAELFSSWCYILKSWAKWNTASVLENLLSGQHTNSNAANSCCITQVPILSRQR